MRTGRVPRAPLPHASAAPTVPSVPPCHAPGRRARPPVPALLPRAQRPTLCRPTPTCAPRLRAQRPARLHAQLGRVVGTVTILRYSPCPALLPCHNTICIAIQTSLQPAFLSHNTLGVLRYSLSQLHALSSLQYNNCIAIQSSQPSSLAIHSCNTISASLGHITIQILLSQYDLGSSPSKFLLHFFLFFIINIFFFNYFQQLEKSLKKKLLIIIFFHFLEHSHKFIKIYFTPFSSILLLVKS